MSTTSSLIGSQSIRFRWPGELACFNANGYAVETFVSLLIMYKETIGGELFGHYGR